MNSQLKGRIFRGISVAAVAIGASAMIAEAASINYGDYVGQDVTFQQVTESSSDPVPLYGAPTGVTNNTIDFDPLTFQSSSSGGSADVTDGLVTFFIQADPGFFITDLTFEEFGDYTLAGAGTAATSAIVGQSIFVEVVEINGVVQANPPLINFNSIFNPSNGDYFLPGEAAIAAPWFGIGTLDIQAALAQQDIAGNATKIKVISNNTLVTTSESGTVSFIKKKDLDIGVEVGVPEPAALSLAVLGLGLMFRRR